MHLIVLTGLVVIEKIDLTVDLALHYQRAGQRVAILDNIARMPIDSEVAPVEPKRINGDALDSLPNVLADTQADVVVFAVSETTRPESLFVALDTAQHADNDLTVTTLALIDLRTCDCFPNVREQLEAYADHTIMMPYEMADIKKQLVSAI